MNAHLDSRARDCHANGLPHNSPHERARENAPHESGGAHARVCGDAHGRVNAPHVSGREHGRACANAHDRVNAPRRNCARASACGPRGRRQGPPG